MTTFTRQSVDGITSTLSYNEAVEQFIRDNCEFGEVDEELREDYQNDMPTVFETRDILDEVQKGGEVSSGIAIYIRN